MGSSMRSKKNGLLILVNIWIKRNFRTIEIPPISPTLAYDVAHILKISLNSK